MFGFHKKKRVVKEYDHERYEPVLRSSICTGETTAGFLDRTNQTYREVLLINDDSDLEEFRETYGIEGEIRVTY
jgi:hypothetical protein